MYGGKGYDLCERVSLTPERGLLHNIALPICVVDQFARICHWNGYSETLFGIPADAAIRREWHSVIDTERTSGCCALCQTRRALSDGKCAEPVAATLRISGSRRSVIMVPVPLEMDAQGGRSIGFLILAQESAHAEAVKRPIPIHSRVRQLDEDRMIAELTPRERQILDCVVNGMDARSIGEHLGITHATARNYVQRILNKLGARNKAEAVSVALTYNLLAS